MFLFSISPSAILKIGWADSVPNSQGWQIGSTNHCIFCPAGTKSCGSHHSSPVNLDRNLNVVGSSIYNECIDGHWMKYYDSSCGYDELRELNAFTIERYGLKIKQPMGTSKSGNFYGIACSQQPGTGRRWGRVDFPKGYSQWWLLSHIDFHVPSEHTQNGKRYSAELQLHHYYSVTAEEAGIDNGKIRQKGMTISAVSLVYIYACQAVLRYLRHLFSLPVASIFSSV
jgi:Eukaryotic-type carbonic anhydrase